MLCIENLGEFCSSACMDAENRGDEDEGQEKEWQRAGAATGEQLALVGRIAGIVGGVIVLAVVIGAAWFAWKHWLHPWGRPTWIIDGGGSKPIANRIVKADDTELVALLGADILAIQPASGNIRWRVRTVRDYWPVIRTFPGGYELRHSQAFARLSEDGEPLWATSFDKQRQLLAAGDNLALFISGHWLGYDEWSQLEKKAGREPPDLSGYTVGPLKKPPVWIEDKLIAMSLQDGKDLWTRDMQRLVTFNKVDIGSDLCVALVTVAQEKWEHRRLVDRRETPQLVTLDSTNGKLRWYKPLRRVPVWGPRVEAGHVVFCDFDHTHYVDRAGNVVRSEEGLREAEAMPLGDEVMVPLGAPKEAGGDGIDVTEEQVQPFWMLLETGDDPAVRPAMTGGVALVDPETGAEKWTFNLEGGITSYGSDAEHVYVVGHATEAGGQGQMIAQATRHMGLDGPEAAIIGAGAGVADWVLVGLDRQTGREVWRQKDVAGTIVTGDGKLVVLQDTRLTSTRVLAGNLAGELAVHQFKPASGKKLWTRKYNDLAIGDARILGGRLVGISYDRQPRPDDEESRGNCTGLIGIRLR